MATDRQLGIQLYFSYFNYGKCTKFSDTKVPDKTEYANSVDPDQTEQSDLGLHSLPFHKVIYQIKLIYHFDTNDPHGLTRQEICRKSME